MTGSESFDMITYLPGAEAIIAQLPSGDLFTEPESTIIFGSRKIVPWGEDNNLPAEVMEMVEKSEVVSSNLNFNIRIAYGLGVKPMLRIKDGRKLVHEPCEDPKVLDFIEANDIDGYFLEQCADMCTFGNNFPELIITKDRKEIFSLRHKEAVFSRWGVVDAKTGEIPYHYYGANWTKAPTKELTTTSEVISKYNSAADLAERMSAGKQSRFIVPINFPTPGKTYYQRPPYWSIFRSGSYDFSTMIWEFKKTILKNGLRVRYIIYISKKYWENIFREEKIDTNDPTAVKKRKDAEMLKFRNFLSSDKNHGNGLAVLKEMIPSGSSAIEEKYITIENVPVDLKGGELLQDSSEVSRMISYAMGVHQNVIGTDPGKSGSLSGTDKRELFMISSALMKPSRDRLLKPLYIVKKINKFPANLEWIVPEYEFTTLDESETGKETIIVEDQQKTQ
jgi:hypothetical protein